jgi:anti-sigma B factor antagonist
MSEHKLSAAVHQAGPFTRVLDLTGEISSLSSNELTEAYNQAIQGHIRAVIFNFTGVSYMNSFGIGMLVMLIIRARREGIHFVGYGLNDHFRNIFKLTRLDEVIPLHPNEETALAALQRYDLPEREY